ncbi:MAG: carboxylating nicotinate-nucleotide diphosphorylase [Bacteroidales bacterium]|jgi:nicotinate-nucleotide pyrophosphorylase (carboxylating)|nr:carboxylating nicotinate-nucleotide diphosphorylase [Bacteroidales bacterium]
MIDTAYVKNHILQALQEDIGSGDYSSLCCIGEKETNKARLVAKQEGIICGIEVAKMVFEAVDSSLVFTAFKTDGDRIAKGDIVFTIGGKARSILSAERTALNYIQRLSGIATQTAEYVALIEGTKARLLDTRKTTPTLRLLEKYAVKTGGGCNHRIGLYDMIMLKDNHVDFAGGIEQAITMAYDFVTTKQPLKIEIEVRNLSELDKVLAIGKIDRIMLDNFSVEDLCEAVKIINHRYETEASGGINKQTIRAFAETGVDFISVGALTHQIHSLDLSLVADR